MLDSRHSALCLLLLVVPSMATAEEVTLNFPKHSVGILTAVSKNNERDSFSRPAQGSISIVSSGLTLSLSLSENASKDLTFLRKLPLGALEELILNRGQIDADSLHHIVRQSGLKSLQFSGCEFSEDAFRGLACIDSLIDLRIPPASRADILDWIGKHKKLQRLFCYPSLDANALKAIGPLPDLQETSVVVGADPNKTLELLTECVNLRFLSLNFDRNQASGEAIPCQAVEGLEHIEELRWFYGTVDGESLKSLSKLPALKRLQFVQINPETNFTSGLGSLESLESLECSFAGDGDALGIESVSVLASLKNLKKWPKLHRLDAESLQKIAACPWIEGLTLFGLAKNTPESYLCDALRKLPCLQRIDLQNLPLSDRDLESLAGANQLESIRLFSTQVSGSGFHSLVDLPRLNEISWFGGFADDSPIPPDLSSLPSLAALKSVDIAGAFVPSDLVPLGQCTGLLKIRLWGEGFADDSVAMAIAGLPKLKRLSLSDNSVITDAGAMALAECESLEEVLVGGFFTLKGARALATLPRLRRLSARSMNVSVPDFAEFKRELTGIPFVSGGRQPRTSIVQEANGQLRKKLPGKDLIHIGEDGILRKKGRGDKTLRTAMDAMEGRPAAALASASTDLRQQLEQARGNVILLDFWGTWCGPCRSQIKKLQEIESKYRQQGFEIIGIHTAKWSDRLEGFMIEKDITWQNIVDESSEIKHAFEVPHYPSYYLIDRKGILRVALADPLGLMDAVDQLIAEE